MMMIKNFIVKEVAAYFIIIFFYTIIIIIEVDYQNKLSHLIIILIYEYLINYKNLRLYFMNDHLFY